MVLTTAAALHHCYPEFSSILSTWRGSNLGLVILGSLMTSRFASGLVEAESPQITNVIPSSQLGELADSPYALLSPEAEAQLEAVIQSSGSQVTGMSDQFLGALQETAGDN